VGTARIGKIFHLIHLTDDFFPLMEWYDRVFSPRHFVDHKTESFPYSGVEKRYANLIVIGDTILEPLSPAMNVEGWETLPVGRFYTRFGAHWHSIAWYVNDVGAMYDDLVSEGIRILGTRGVTADARPSPEAAIFTHPKDTRGAFEFVERLILAPDDRRFIDDPRFLPGWDPMWWATNHPLGLERLASITVVVEDVERATSTYQRVLGARVLYEDEVPVAATRSTFVAIGEDTVVELAQPMETSSLAGTELEKNGEIMHAITWKVRDLDRAADHLEANGIIIRDRDATTIVAEPKTTFEAVFRFTTADMPSDPVA
jgi:catechol 2,3-dioxygenase-like lactoylglutathione lyase family enzyme